MYSILQTPAVALITPIGCSQVVAGRGVVSRVPFVHQGTPWDPPGSTCKIVYHTRIHSRFMHIQYSSDIRTFSHDSPRVIPFHSPRSLGIASASGIVFYTDKNVNAMIPSHNSYEHTPHSKKSHLELDLWRHSIPRAPTTLHSPRASDS